MHKSELVFSHKLFNPLFWHIRSAMKDKDIRYIFERGGSSSGKTVSTVQAVLISVLSGTGSAVVFRKVAASIRNTIYEEFKVQSKYLRIYDFFDCKENCITCANGCRIDFSGLDNPEKIKGITNYKYIVLEEVSEFDYADYTQITLRLRGKPGFKVFCLFNPISEEHWIKKKIFDSQEWAERPNTIDGVFNPITGDILREEYSTISGVHINGCREIFNDRTGGYDTYPPDTIELLSTFKNNFWVVGSPEGDYGFYDKQTIANYEWYRVNDYNYYRIYALGEWGSIRTGGEFLMSFNDGKHTGDYPYIDGLPVHISIDDNVLPYISVSVWQCMYSDSGKILRQVHEVCADDPYNTVTQAATIVVKWLESIGYNDVLYMYGDSTMKKSNNIDEEKRSFKDKFKETLELSFRVVERMPNSNPSVSMSGEFVNSILSGMFNGINIQVNKTCTKSLNDYKNVKKDVNGGILKKRIKDKLTGQSYEEFGHLTDTMRYFLCEILNKEYTRFSLRRKHNSSQESDIRYYNENNIDFKGSECMVEMNPCVNGLFVAVKARVMNGCVYITDILYPEFPEDDVCISFLSDSCSIQMEAPKEYIYYLDNIREKNIDIFGRADRPNKCGRINSHINYIRERFYFPSDDKYSLFIENILDYDGVSNYEVLNALACISERVKRNINN